VKEARKRAKYATHTRRAGSNVTTRLDQCSFDSGKALGSALSRGMGGELRLNGTRSTTVITNCSFTESVARLVRALFKALLLYRICSQAGASFAIRPPSFATPLRPPSFLTITSEHQLLLQLSLVLSTCHNHLHSLYNLLHY
jgi:hypothetical protein